MRTHITLGRVVRRSSRNVPERGVVESRLTMNRSEVPDVEILESWYPVLFDERRVRTGPNGAGEHRSGGGNRVTFRPHGTDRLVGQMLGMRAYVPLEGIAGGLPGAT